MKSYRDFVSESYVARENLNEVLGLRTLGNLAFKGAKAVFGTNTGRKVVGGIGAYKACLLYTSPSPRDATLSRMPSSA